MCREWGTGKDNNVGRRFHGTINFPAHDYAKRNINWSGAGAGAGAEQLPPNLIKYLTITQLVTTYRRIEKRTSERQTNIAQKRRPFSGQTSFKYFREMLPGKLTGSKTSADIDAAAKSGTMMSCRSQKMRASTIKLADVDKGDKTDET